MTIVFIQHQMVVRDATFQMWKPQKSSDKSNIRLELIMVNFNDHDCE